MFTQKTIGLAVLALLLGLANLLDLGGSKGEKELLPVLSALNRDTVQRLEISTAVNKVVLTRVDDTWHMVAPLEHEADQMHVRSILTTFRKDIPMDVRLDHGNLDTYGLDASSGLLVEAWDSQDELPVLSFTLGGEAEGGSNFIRVSGDESVYRARVGGRKRYEREPTDWRNKVLLDLEKDQITGLKVSQPGGGVLDLYRTTSTELSEEGEPLPGPWALEPDLGWMVDQNAVEAMVRSLGRMRAGAILAGEFDAGFDSPTATIEVVVDDGSSRTIQVGSREDDSGTFVRIADAEGVLTEEVFKVSRSTIASCLEPAETFRDRTIFRFGRKDVDTFTMDEADYRVVLRHDLASRLWQVVEPLNVDLDIKQVFFAINTMAELRAAELAPHLLPETVGLDEADLVFTVRLLDGASKVLEVGGSTRTQDGKEARYAREAGSDAVFLLPTATIEKFMKAFGRR
ncbi:MAG: DUF4340 domain-containing protein [Myxococcota bacterium]|jgi:hypothetical protein|nr:DUF4340 domain-containing protein [Myxococcota bacterium]